MIQVDADAERMDGVTYVTVTVTNQLRTVQRVRLGSQLEGPVWAPGDSLMGSPQWQDGVWTGTIDPGNTRGIGFASPADPPATGSPVELLSTDRADSESKPTPDEVIASLEDWAPPTTAVPSDK